jgi:amino acid permease
MIILSIIQLSKVGAKGNPPIANVSGMTNLFGVCVYAFMCHHSLPQMTTPIRNKSSIYRLIAADYLFIMAFYLLLCFTAVYTFADIEDLYTLNFGPGVPAEKAITNIAFIEYFLALFPVFSLSSSFPIIAITLRNNLKTLSKLFRRNDEPYPWAVERLVFPVVTMVIPIIIAFATDDIQVSLCRCSALF